VSTLAALLGALTVAGLAVALAGLLPTTTAPAAPSRGRLGATVRRRIGQSRALAALGAGTLGWLVTGWPVPGLAAAAVVVAGPWLMLRGAKGEIARLEALEQWTRRLADLLASGAGLEQAMIASARTAPAPIAAEVTGLANRLRAHVPTETALRALADDLNSLSGDDVVAELIVAARRRGRGVKHVLDELARSVAEVVIDGREIETAYAKPRTVAQSVVAIVLVFVAVLFVWAHTFFAPYGRPAGQVILAAVGGWFAAMFAVMHRLAARTAETGRFLPDERTSDPDLAPAAAMTAWRAASSLNPGGLS